MDLSVVIPVKVKNEADNLAPLVREICTALDGFIRYEIIIVDDGSEDSSVAEVMGLAAKMAHLRLLRHAQNRGQSAAIRTGIRAARAEWIATLDGDGQNDPADIRKLWKFGMSRAGTAPILINGYRRRRRDSWSKRTASRFANAVRRRLLGDDTPDTGCGLKLFSRSLFLNLPFFDHMHRFLPALVLREGGAVYSVPVNHRPRSRGASKYGVFDRLGVGIVDLFGVMWLRRRAARPHLLDEPTPERTATSDSSPAAMPR